MEEEINKAISFKSSDQPKVSKYYRAEEVRLDFDDNTDELSEEESFFEKDSDCESEATEEDVDLDFDIVEAPKVDLAYLPCAAHNIQLVVNDGLNLDTTYTQLINKVSKNIVSKSKVVAVIAEEIRALSKSLYKSVVTRWNSILFMIRSVLKLTDKDFISIKTQLKNKKKLTKKQKET